MSALKAVQLPIMIGKVLLTNAPAKAVNVGVVTMKLEPTVNVYFNEETKYWAADPNLKCQVGDMVLIRKLEHYDSTSVQHEVREIVFPVGHIIDPVTGRRCRGTRYMDMDNRTFKNISQFASTIKK